MRHNLVILHDIAHRCLTGSTWRLCLAAKMPYNLYLFQALLTQPFGTGLLRTSWKYTS